MRIYVLIKNLFVKWKARHLSKPLNAVKLEIVSMALFNRFWCWESYMGSVVSPCRITDSCPVKGPMFCLHTRELNTPPFLLQMTRICGLAIAELWLTTALYCGVQTQTHTILTLVVRLSLSLSFSPSSSKRLVLSLIPLSFPAVMIKDATFRTQRGRWEDYGVM